MNKSFCLLLLFCFLCASICAQDLRRKAEETPLNCARYLEFKGDELAFTFFKVGRFTEGLQIIDSLESHKDKSQLYYQITEHFLEKGDKTQAEKILLKFVTLPKDEIYSGYYPKIVENLVSLEREKEALDFVQSLDDDEQKLFSLIGMAKAFALKGQNTKSTETISQALRLKENLETKEDFDNIEFDNIKFHDEILKAYLSIGENQKAFDLVEKINLSQKAEPARIDYLLDSLVNVYIKNGKAEKAIELIDGYEYFDTDKKNLNKAIVFAKSGDKEKAVTQLQRITHSDDNSYYQDEITNLYLKLGEDVFALEQAKIIEYDYSQQKSLLAIADFYVSQKRNDSAIYVLNNAFDQSQKIITDNHQESSRDSTSPQMDKAIYANDIARKFVSMNRLDLALNVADKIEKPFRKANLMVEIAEKQSVRKAVDLLNKSLAIVTKSKKGFLDVNKYIIWAKIAERFAGIGAKEKSLSVFAELLNDFRVNQAEDYNLIEIGYHFEQTGLKANGKIKKALREIIKQEKSEE